MKLSQWAKLNSLSYRTAFNHYQKGWIPGAYSLNTGTIVVPDLKPHSPKQEWNVIYTRVSSSENKPNLLSQSERLQHFCSAKGWTIHEIIQECASGLNDTRPKLTKLLQERKATRLIVEHKDCLTRFGFNFIKTLYSECEIIVVNQTESEKQSLMEDFVSLITSFCARIYGHRRSKRKTEEIIKQLSEN